MAIYLGTPEDDRCLARKKMRYTLRCLYQAMVLDQKTVDETVVQSIQMGADLYAQFGLSLLDHIYPPWTVETQALPPTPYKYGSAEVHLDAEKAPNGVSFHNPAGEQLIYAEIALGACHV